MDWPLVIFLAGMIIGGIIVYGFKYVRASYGTLKIDRLDPKKDIYRLEIGDLDKLSRKKWVILKIHVRKFETQKEQSLL